MTAGEKVGNALFQSVTLRTAGYSVLDQGAAGRGGCPVRGADADWGLLRLHRRRHQDGHRRRAADLTVGRPAGRDQVVLRRRTIPQARVLNAMTLTLVVTCLFLAGPSP